MATVPELQPEQVAALGERIAANVTKAVKVPEDTLRDLLVSVLAEGHVLIEDNPGVGKTALARALARSIDAEYARIQCTADLLPADVVGTNVFNQREARFEFRPGPVFANVVLVDEINRASPKTQSGLLECMQERHVTVDVHTHELARPFVVIATQNPIEYEGTYPLPEAQLDRFMVRVALGYPAPAAEAEMLNEQADGDRVLELEPVAGVGEVLAAQGAGVTRAAGSSTVEEEDPYLVKLEVRRGLLPPPGGRLDEPLLERPLRVRRHSPGRLRVEVSFGRRGHRRLAPARLVIEDPLGISVRELFSEPAEVLVLPRVYPIAGEAAGALKGLGSEAERLAASAAE